MRSVATARAPGLTELMRIVLKRVYDEAGDDDGWRVLVDRLWPRGLSKERAAVDEWAKDVAPSTELRRAFHHDGMAWEDFSQAYLRELAENPALTALRRDAAAHEVVTLLYGAQDEERNHAAVLREALLEGSSA